MIFNKSYDYIFVFYTYISDAQGGPESFFANLTPDEDVICGLGLHYREAVKEL